MMITQSQVKELFQYRDGNLYWKIIKVKNQVKVGDLTGHIHHTGYRLIKINNKMYSSHRLIFLYHYGYLPNEIDHIDGNRLNNDIENLREVTRSQNQWNRKSNKNSLSIYKGVSWHKPNKKWMSHIGINGKKKHLGLFNLEINATLAYDRAAFKNDPIHSKLNFPMYQKLIRRNT